jgi:hypothetical protein
LNAFLFWATEIFVAFQMLLNLVFLRQEAPKRDFSTLEGWYIARMFLFELFLVFGNALERFSP